MEAYVIVLHRPHIKVGYKMKERKMMDCFSQACMDFRVAISLKKTNVMGQDAEAPPGEPLTNDY